MRLHIIMWAHEYDVYITTPSQRLNKTFLEYIEDIYFFEVNTKYISSSELKTSKFSRVRSYR